MGAGRVKQATGEVTIKTATALTTAHSGYASDAVAVKGLEWLALHMTYVYDSATSVETVMQSSADGSTGWRDCYRTTEGVGEVDEASDALGASGSVSRVWFTGPYNFVRFTAKRTGGSASDTLALAYSAV